MLSEAGQSYHQIAQCFGVRAATVSDLVNKYRQTAIVNNYPGQGRQKKSTKRQDHQLLQL